VERRLAEIGAALVELRQSELYRLRDSVIAAEAQARDLLTEMADQLRREMAVARTRLKVFSSRKAAV
jgi:hypothetical protein